MGSAAPDEDGPTFGGCALAAVIGPAVVAGSALAFSMLTGRPLDFDSERGVFFFQILLVAAPFLPLAIAGTSDKLPWLVALALTFAFWGYYLFDGVRYHWSGDRSGANIGLGLILLASPVTIIGASMGVYAWRRRRRRRSSRG